MGEETRTQTNPLRKVILGVGFGFVLSLTAGGTHHVLWLFRLLYLTVPSLPTPLGWTTVLTSDLPASAPSWHTIHGTDLYSRSALSSPPGTLHRSQAPRREIQMSK